ncbi:MAG: hypothetical protein GY760_18875 [Deltaproteobacteria bacterium]|nr:hypothetical protein [Deltaproteobacteria bacterium]
MKKIFLTTILFIMICKTAYSTVLFEPGVGFAVGRFDQLGTDVGGDFKGLYLSGRLCHNFDSGVFAGIDFRTYSLLTTTSGDPNYNTSLLNTSRGFTLGFTPIDRLRFWFSYQFINSFIMPESTTSDVELSDGKAFIAGIGYMGIKWISVNIEYATYYFDKAKDGSDHIQLTNDYSIRTFMISFSFPMDF